MTTRRNRGWPGNFPPWLDVYKDHLALFGYYADETRSIKNTSSPVIWGARGIFYFTYRNRVDPKTNPECAELNDRPLSEVRLELAPGQGRIVEVR